MTATAVETKKKAIPEISPQAQWLVARLRKMQPGDVVTYAELDKVAGCDVRGDGKGYMATARRVVLRDYCIAISAVRGQGMKRLDDEGLAEEQARAIELTAKRLRREEKRAQVANPDKLGTAARLRFQANRGQALAMRAIASHRTHNALVAAATRSQSSEIPSMEQLLLALRGSKGAADE